MFVTQKNESSDHQVTLDPLADCQSRVLNETSVAIRSALRKVVHEYVSGWGIVLHQSPRERRRKKRLWDCRSSARQAFTRPVWVHQAHWGQTATGKSRSVLVQRTNDMFLVHDISYEGIGLTSDRPPKSRLVVLEFDSWRGKPIEIVVSLRWRKRVGGQYYRCGGSIRAVLIHE